MDTFLTRREIKRQAKERLRTDDNWKQLMIANIIPWLLAVVFAVVQVTQAAQILQSIDPNNVADSINKLPSNSSWSLVQNLMTTMFTQGVAFTALELWRKPDYKFNPWQALLQVFTGQWFWAIIAIWLLSSVAESIGMMLFIIPGILLLFGLSQSFYTLYDARTNDEQTSALTAMIASWRLMRGFKLDLFVLSLTLLGWTILQRLTLHLLDFAINPYLQLVYAGFYDNIRKYQVLQQ